MAEVEVQLKVSVQAAVLSPVILALAPLLCTSSTNPGLAPRHRLRLPWKGIGAVVVTFPGCGCAESLVGGMVRFAPRFRLFWWVNCGCFGGGSIKYISRDFFTLLYFCFLPGSLFFPSHSFASYYCNIHIIFLVYQFSFFFTFISSVKN